MRIARLLFVAGCVGSIAGGCTSDLKLSLENKSCNDDYRCVSPYVCDRKALLCVLPRLGDGGLLSPTGGDSGDAGSSMGGAGSGQGGAGSGAGLSGSSGIAGHGGLDDGGAAGSDDAGPPELVDGGPDGCVPTTLFGDRDGDTYGDVTDTGFGCPQLGWVTRAGDCRDDIAIVNPGQTGFFGSSFSDQNKAGGVSFDYDCNNAEEPSPNNDTNDEAPACSILGAVGCEGSGFLPANDPPRAGSGADARCGSVIRRDCQPNGLGCQAVDTPVAETLQFLCH